MYKHRRNANTFFFIRYQFWPFLVPSIGVLFLLFCPQFSHSLQINTNEYNQLNENTDRTVAQLGPRDLQQATTLPSASTASELGDLNHALYIVSLDGKITAIDAHGQGRQLWRADTGAALVDSSLSRIEISRDSRSVRLIPSLIGGLFEKYDEDGHVEPLPFDADALLDASFKLHDELVITGGKHIDTLGLDLHTGKILYSFSKENTQQPSTLDNNQTTSDGDNPKSTLVVKRTTQTVRARSARNGYEKWNFSVSNHELLHMHAKPAGIVLEQVDVSDDHEQRGTLFSGYFEYQLQTGVVLAFDTAGQLAWSSAVNAPIAAVWELKNGQLHEKSLFETNTINRSEEDEPFTPPLVSRRLAFIGEFNATPYVIVSPRVQKQLIFDARKNTIAEAVRNKRPILSSWDKAYQKRTLPIDAGISEDNYQRFIGATPSDHTYPLALRPDPSNNHLSLSSSSSMETCDTAGYLELIRDRNENGIGEEDDDDDDHDSESQQRQLVIHSKESSPSNSPTIWTVFLSTLIIIMSLWHLKQKQTEILRQQSLMTESSASVSPAPPSTPVYHQLEPTPTPPFQSRYTLEYEHVRFLGRGGFGVVFEAINKLDERRVAIKRVSLKKASGKERALKEIRYLAVLNHPNLIQYYYAWNESPPVGWQEEEDKTLFIRVNSTTRDSMSSFPTSLASGNDSGSTAPAAHLSSISTVHATKPRISAPSPLLDFTFDHSPNPLRIDEDFSGNSIDNNDKSDTSSSSSSSSSWSSSDEQTNKPLDANNNNQLNSRGRSLTATTKSSVSSSSPLFDHSSDSSSLPDEFIDPHPQANDVTESDDGIIFLPDDKRSTSSSPQQTQTKSLIERRKLLSCEKEMPPTYFYFVMELCRPESLRDRLIQRAIDRHQAWSIFDQIIRGIEYIHSQKLIHRDLKPSNILFSMDNTVKIGDFGLVSAFGEDKLAKKKKKRDDEKFERVPPIETVSFTSEGGENNEMGGTILYMSPEQMHREPYNQKVDIYAMGIILFELLYPFSTQMERMQAIVNVRLQTPVFPVDFEQEGSNRSQLICRLIRWLLSYSPRDRPRACDLRQDSFYQRMLRLEVPHLFGSDNRQPSQTIVSGQEQTPSCQQQQRGRIASPFRRTVSSSVLHSHRNSESGDIECVS